MPDQDRRDELLDDLQSFADDIGHAPTRSEMNDDGPYSSTPYYNEFGSWNAALEAAALDVNHRGVSDEELLDELRALADRLDHAPRWEDMRDEGAYDPSTYIRRWGSWLDARDAAGLEASEVRHGRRIDRDELVDALRGLALDIGRPPSQSDMNERGTYSTSPYYREFDSWQNALQAAGVAGDRYVDPPRGEPS